MREKEAYRENLARLDELAPDKELLRTSDVMRLLKLSRNGAQALLAGHLVGGKWISKAALARLIS